MTEEATISLDGRARGRLVSIDANKPPKPENFLDAMSQEDRQGFAEAYHDDNEYQGFYEHETLKVYDQSLAHRYRHYNADK